MLNPYLTNATGIGERRVMPTSGCVLPLPEDRWIRGTMSVRRHVFHRGYSKNDKTGNKEIELHDSNESRGCGCGCGGRIPWYIQRRDWIGGKTDRRVEGVLEKIGQVSVDCEMRRCNMGAREDCNVQP